MYWKALPLCLHVLPPEWMSLGLHCAMYLHGFASVIDAPDSKVPGTFWVFIGSALQSTVAVNDVADCGNSL